MAKNPKTEKKQPPRGNPVSPQKNDGIKQVAAGAAKGAVGVGGAALLMGFRAPDETFIPANLGGGTPNVYINITTFDGAQVSTATSTTDEMGFAEAFASARQEMGPGGVFVWNGNVYSTFFAEEWESLPDDYKEGWTNHPWSSLLEDVYGDVYMAYVDDEYVLVPMDEEPIVAENIAIVEDEVLEISEDDTIEIIEDIDVIDTIEVNLAEEVHLPDDDAPLITDNPDPLEDFNNEADVSNFA